MKSIMTKFGVFALVSLFGITLGAENNLVRAESLQKVTIRMSADIPPPPMPTSVAMGGSRRRWNRNFQVEVKFSSTTLAHSIRT